MRFFQSVGIIDPAPSPITSNSSGSSAPPSAGPRISGIFHQDSPSTNLLDSEDVYSSPSAGEGTLCAYLRRISVSVCEEISKDILASL